jgi:predicted GIY-YIG superfamily endonuclease
MSTTKTWYVYIALLEDRRFYVGMTHFHPDERARRHQIGWGGTFTRGISVIRILWFEVYPSAESARKRERQIKRWTHAKKQALIDGDVAQLKALSRSRKNR